ncbi:branched-chain amino acid ABC transporter permease [Actinoplanes sp. NPDC000266]
MATTVVNLLDGIAYGLLLFTVGAGLALIFGVMDVLNLAHGTLYLAGAYVAALFTGTGLLGFLTAVLAGAACGALAGGLLTALLRPLREAGQLEQALLTLGIAFVAGWAFTQLAGADPQPADPPGLLAGSVTVLGRGYPLYRLLFIGVAAAIAVALHVVVRRTPAGMVLRATVSDPAMAAAAGIRTGRVRTVALAVGASLAVGAGVLGAPLIGPAPGVDTHILTLSLIVVVLGGAGSIPHTLTAALLVGQVQAFTAALPALAPFLLFGAVLAVFVTRGRAATAVRRA